MTPSRILIALVLLAFVGLAAIKAIRSRESQLSQPDRNQSDTVREFWRFYKEASHQRSAGDLGAAVSLYEKSLALRPQHEDSLYYLGNCYFELGRYADAANSYQNLISINPLGSSRGYMQLGLIYACLEPASPKDLNKAYQYFSRANEVDPDSGGLLGMGEVALLRGQWEEARQLLLSANDDNPMSMAAPYLLGYLAYRNKAPQEAGNWFHMAVQRGELKKGAIKWTEEGDLKADPELRWRALARQSVFGKYWLPLRRYLKEAAPSQVGIQQEYSRLDELLKKRP
ncbi:MAG: tetratricopeptide repeat protein [Acidobacteriota bacterium]